MAVQISIASDWPEKKKDPRNDNFPPTPSFVRQPVTWIQPEQIGMPIAVIAPEEYRRLLSQKPRQCLRCSKTFHSTGAGHRICSPCKEADAWTSPAEFSIHASY